MALAAWNAARGGDRTTFSAQVSIDVARDAEMLGLLAEADFENVFIGIEMPNAESLAGVRNRQNLKVDLAAEVGRIAGAGVMPICGLIVAFDHDGPDIFERQDAFVADLPAPLLMTGLLVAPTATPLHAHMIAENRLVDAAARRWPDLSPVLTTIVVFDCQTRHSLAHQGLWDPALGRRDAPPLSA